MSAASKLPFKLSPTKLPETTQTSGRGAELIDDRFLSPRRPTRSNSLCPLMPPLSLTTSSASASTEPEVSSPAAQQLDHHDEEIKSDSFAQFREKWF